LEHILASEVYVQAGAADGASEGLHAATRKVGVQKEVDGEIFRLSGAAEGSVFRWELVDFPRASPEQKDLLAMHIKVGILTNSFRILTNSNFP